MKVTVLCESKYIPIFIKDTFSICQITNSIVYLTINQISLTILPTQDEEYMNYLISKYS